MIKIYKPYLPPKSLEYAHEALNSGWLSSQGQYIQKATEKLEDIFQTRVILLNNGTAGVHLTAKALHKTHPEIKTVIVPNNCYVAAINGFLFDQNHLLIPVDASLETWNYDLELLDQTIKLYSAWGPIAVLIVHNLGNIINLPELKKKYPKVVWIEDNCEGLFGKYDGTYSGKQSLASAFSFYGNKNITCGEGGGIFVNGDNDLFDYLYCIQGQGQSSVRFIHKELGTNYRLNNISAAILYGQLEIVDEILDKKNRLFEKYRTAFKDHEKIIVQKEEVGTISANWMFGVRIVGNPGYQEAEKYFADRGVEARPMFFELSRHCYLEGILEFGDERVAKQLNKGVVVLPSYPELSDEEFEYVVKVVKEYAEGL